MKQLIDMKKAVPWLKEVVSISLQASLEDLGESYQRYYKKISGKLNFKKKT